VLLFAIALAVLSAVLFSLAPLVQVAKIEIVEFIKEGTRSIAGGRDRLRRALVVAQFALGLVLLSGASLLAATFIKIETRDAGFRPDHVLKFAVDLPEAQYPLPKQIAFDHRLVERLSTIPGVESVASGWPLPFEGDQASVSFNILERPAPIPERPHADIAIVTPGFFQTLGIPLIRGRAFTQHDDMNAPPVVIVNQAFADRFFPGEDVIGKQIQSGATNGKGPAKQIIVGVVGNARQSALKLSPDPIYYFPYKQLSWGFGWILLRTSIPPRSVESAARAALASVDPGVPMYKVATMEGAFSTAISPARFVTWLLGSFAAVALLLTMIGVYGVMAYSVAKRTRDIGVRIAVGADRSAILRMIAKEAAVLVCLGVTFGAVASAATTRLLEYIPYVISFSRPVLPIAASICMALTGALAAYLPARRAASIDPVQALRME
jgi:putative ABC transport system permease protein